MSFGYVDLYQIHRLDAFTPMEEILEALHDVVKSGKARYIGACTMSAWQFERMQNLAEMHGRTMAQESLAWMMSKPFIGSPVVGTTSVKHVEKAVSAVDIVLSDDEVKALEAPYVPHVKSKAF